MKVKKSAISSVGSGVARMHSSHLDVFDEEKEHEMISISSAERSIVAKLVSDRLAPRDVIILREGDMDELKIEEGDEVTIEPYQKMTDEIKGKWNKFVSRFKKEEEED